jgi:adenylosuccinate synthase
MRNLSVVGLQWGDEGKGKVVDFLAGGFDAVARFNGGSNAGHTVVLSGRKYTFHLVPSGVLKGKELLIGAGVVLDPDVLADELKLLPPSARKRMLVDGRCTLVTPLEKKFDAFLEEMRGASAIGTTMRGIGPAYAMRALRLSPRVSDLLDGFEFGDMEKFYKKVGVSSTALKGWAASTTRLLKGISGDVASRVEAICERGGSVLYEGSQGTLLDLLHGSYPYVTSSHTIASYVASALGIPPSLEGEPLGVAKCYTTRVGGGPFPTELKGGVGDLVRKVGNEFGSTTGRPRRVGWLDLVALRYAVKLNGVEKVAVTKLDVLSKVKELKVCTAYEDNGTETTSFQKSLPHLGDVTPVYESLGPLYGADFEGPLPRKAKDFIDFLERELSVQVVLASHGDERSSTTELGN